MSGNGANEVCGVRSGSTSCDGRVELGGAELEGLLGGVPVRDIDEGAISPRQEMTHVEEKRQSESSNSTNWNDVQANSIGVNKALGWDYDFCRIEWPRIAVVSGKLYIDGGILWLSPKGKGLRSIREINTRLLEIDINSPIYRDNYTIRVISKPTSVPNVGAGQVFLPPSWPSPNNGRFYTFGGQFPSFNRSLDTYVQPPKDPQGDLFSYDTKSDKWEKVSMAKDSDQVIWSQGGTSVSIPELGLGFYLGGFQNSSTNSVLKDSDYRAVSGFLRLEWDMNDPTVAPRWKNESIPFDQTIGGSLIHIPDIGEKGILVKFAGLGVTTGENLPMNGNPMDQIYIYDIAQAAWHMQTASVHPNRGAFPAIRGYACNAVVPAKDNSSYNIYMYGGGGLRGGDGFSDMWVLSLPSFVWIKFGENMNFRTSGMSCTLFNYNQILLVGPRPQRINDNPAADQEQCRPLWSVYDITQSKWVAKLNPLDTELPPVHRNISRVIGGSGSGNAILTEPKEGWKDSKLKTVFDYQKSTSSDNTNSGFNHAALVGGLAGGLVALLMLIVCCIKHRRRSQRTGGFTIFDRTSKSGGDPTQELEAPLPTLAPPGEYHGQGPAKYTAEQPLQELPASYPWAAREGMGENPPKSRSELEGSQEHRYEVTGSKNPPPEAYRPQTHPENTSPPAVSRKVVGEVGNGEMQERGMHIKRPSSRFSEELNNGGSD
ncbi:hypothetical protein EV426DRAFT_670246 [Tirmania nivea]|nr:hypothetical protein EV426DRAFT_670246 [Tirmania nivea]